MKLEIQMTGYDNAGIARVSAVLLPLIEQLAKDCNLAEQWVDRLIVADEFHYGTVIKSVVPGEQFTDANGLLGVAKTLPIFKGDDVTTNHIVIRAEIANALLEGVTTGVPVSEWQPEIQQAAYVLPHEFGHCRDHAERPGSAKIGPKFGGAFKLQKFAGYYGAITTSEYAACFFSGRWVSLSLLAHQFSSDAEIVRGLMTDAHQRRRNYASQRELFDLACAVASAFWFSIIQAAKLFAWRFANETLRGQALDWKQWFNAEVSEVFESLETALAKAWIGYPNDLTEFDSACETAWRDLALAEGFHFAEGANGDGVFFDTVSVRDLIGRSF